MHELVCKSTNKFAKLNFSILDRVYTESVMVLAISLSELGGTLEPCKYVLCLDLRLIVSFYRSLIHCSYSTGSEKDEGRPAVLSQQRPLHFGVTASEAVCNFSHTFFITRNVLLW